MDCYAVILNLRKVGALWINLQEYAHLAVGLVVVAHAVKVKCAELLLCSAIGRGVVPLDISTLYREDLKTCRSTVYSKVWTSVSSGKPPSTANCADVMVDNIGNLWVCGSLFAVSRDKFM